MRTYVVAATAAEQLHTRIYILVAVLLVMFAIALPCAFLGSRLRRRKITSELSSLTGTDKGAQSGRDARHVDDEWWHQQQEADGAPVQQSRWQQALLPPGARPIERPSTPTPSARATTPVPPHVPSHAGPAIPPPAAGPPPITQPTATPPIAARPQPPQPAPNPVVTPPSGPGNFFDGADEDASLGDDWFAKAMEAEDK